MTHKIVHIFLFLLITNFCSGLPLFAESINIYISKSGNDIWSGTLKQANSNRSDGPLLTIKAAQEKARILLKQGSSVNIILREGKYSLTEPWIFTPEDNGTQEKPVIWKSYKDEKVVISAGKLLKNWKKVSGNITGLPGNAASKVWYSEIGVGTKFYSLFNDEGILPQAASGKLSTSTEISKSSPTTLNYQNDELDNIGYIGDAVLHIIPKYFFVYNILPVKSLDKTANVLETGVKSSSMFPLFTQEPQFAEHCYYKIANVIEHLDEPGEWVLNSAEGRIYYFPIDGDIPGDDLCYPLYDELVSFRGDTENRDWVNNIELNGLVLRNAERMRLNDDRVELMLYDNYKENTAIINLIGAQNIRINNCIIENTGGNGIRLGIYASNNTISHNIFRNIGQTGISLIGHGPGMVADNHNNTISNNEIGYCGEIWGSGQGIMLCGSGYNHIHNNLIHHTANHGIAMFAAFAEWWNTPERKPFRPYLNWEDLRIPIDEDKWYYRRAHIQLRHNLVEYNEIHHAGHGYKIADVNCIYIHGSGDGNVFKRNYIHDSFGKGLQAAIRTDDWQFFARVTENVIKNINAPGINMKEINDYENNIIINCDPSSFLFSKKWVWEGSKSPTFPLYGTNMRRNIMVQTMSSTYSDTSDQNIDCFYWSPYYPELLAQPMADNNIFYVDGNDTASEMALVQSQARGLDHHSIADDPMFVDLENGDFRFREGSPALELGIAPITKYGIQEHVGLQSEYKYLEK